MVKYLILFFFAFTSAAKCTTYYVATWGNNDSLGTYGNPWRTINKAATTMIAGDSVLIMEGVYKESVNPVNSGSLTEPITYTNYNREDVVVEGGEEVSSWVQDSGNRYSTTVNFTPSPRFSSSRDPAGNLGGLILQDGAKMRYAMSPSIADVDSPGEYYMNDSVGMGPPYTMYVYIRDLGQGYDPNNYQMLIGRFRKGFDLDGGEDYQVVDGLTFRDYNDNAIHSVGSNYCEFRNLKLYSSFITGIYLTSYSRNNVIEQCIFWDNGHGGIELAQAHSNIVRRNKFTSIDLGDGLGGNGAHMWLGPLTYNSDSCIVENNIGFQTGSDYLRGPFIALRGSYNIVRHNSGINFGMAGMAIIDGGNDYVINNAMDCNLGLACINVFPDAVSDSGHFIQYNDFYAEDPTAKYRWNGVSYNSLAEWEAASGQSNNIDSIPGFAEPDSEDLHLLAGSFCIDAGTPDSASSEDYDGNPRPQGAGYDIGAYEYIPGMVEEKTFHRKKICEITLKPNPSRNGVWFSRSDSRASGRIRIFDISGRLVQTLILRENQSEVLWNGKGTDGILAAPGTYFVICTLDAYPVAKRKVILLR